MAERAMNLRDMPLLDLSTLYLNFVNGGAAPAFIGAIEEELKRRFHMTSSSGASA